MHRERDRILESSDSCLVVIAHIDEDEVFALFQSLMEIFWRDVRSGIFGTHGLTKCHNLWADAYKKLLEDVIIALRFFERDSAEERMLIEIFFVCFDVLCCP